LSGSFQNSPNLISALIYYYEKHWNFLGNVRTLVAHSILSILLILETPFFHAQLFVLHSSSSYGVQTVEIPAYTVFSRVQVKKVHGFCTVSSLFRAENGGFSAFFLFPHRVFKKKKIFFVRPVCARIFNSLNFMSVV
jgi:hypothetical protein